MAVGDFVENLEGFQVARGNAIAAPIMFAEHPQRAGMAKISGLFQQLDRARGIAFTERLLCRAEDFIGRRFRRFCCCAHVQRKCHRAAKRSQAQRQKKLHCVNTLDQPHNRKLNLLRRHGRQDANESRETHSQLIPAPVYLNP